jgi:LPS export ABC transporter permease LptF
LRLLDRYLLREIGVPFAVGMGLFFVVVAFAQVLKLSDTVTGLGVTGLEVLEALLYSLPPLMGLLIPASALFATLLGVGRLASDREFVGMAAIGVSPYRHLRVPGAVGGVLALVCGFTLMVGEPWGIRGLRRVISSSAQRALASGVRVKQFNEWVPGVTFMAQEQVGSELRDVVFADRRESGRPIVISARRGRVGTGPRARDIVFDLYDGTIVVHDDHSDLVRVLRFEESRYRLDVARLVQAAPRTMSSMQGKTMRQLWKESHNKKSSRRKRVSAMVVLQRKVALPLATLIFSLLAVPLALRATSGARARGLLYSAGIVGIYYYLGRAVELAAREGNYPALLAAWTPNLLGLVALGLLVWRMPHARS